MPYTGKPDSLVGWYKSDLVDEDSSVVQARFTSNGVLIEEVNWFVHQQQVGLGFLFL